MNRDTQLKCNTNRVTDESKINGYIQKCTYAILFNVNIHMKMCILFTYEK